MGKRGVTGNWRPVVTAATLLTLMLTVLTACAPGGGFQNAESEIPSDGPTLAQSVPSGTPAGKQMITTFARFPDMPVPAEGEFDLERTVVFGSNDAWFGRMVISTRHSPDQMFDFYQTQLPAFGWQEVTSVRAAVTVMTYARQNRVVTVQIQDSVGAGSQVMITVSPGRNQGNRPVPPSGTSGFPPGTGPSSGTATGTGSMPMPMPGGTKTR